MKLIHMVGFNGILGIGKEEDLKMIKDRLADGKELLVDLKVFWSDQLIKAVIVLKLDKFYYIGVMS